MADSRVSLLRQVMWSLVVIVAFSFCLSSIAMATPVPRVKPEAPGPVYLSQADYAVLQEFFDALGDRRWSRAKARRASLSDPVARSLADWAWLRKERQDLDFRQADKFLDAHKDWPSRAYIQQLAEKKISDQDNPADVFAFFKDREPATGVGNLRLAQAYFAVGDAEAGAPYLRKAWIDHDWSSSQERTIVRTYGRYLSAEDHAKKADRQLFGIIATNTRRILPYLNASDKKMAEARIALLRQDGNALSLFRRLSPEQQADSGVLHAVTRYYRRRDQELTAISYARKAPFIESEIRNRERWWTEKRLLARWALKNGHYEDAYAMTAFTGLIDGASFADAEFEAGWIALRFLDDPERARPHFAYLNAGVTAPISLARAQYWLGRTFEAADEPDRANLHYLVASEYPYTYYGQLAWEKVSDKINPPSFPGITRASEDDKVVFNARPLVYAMRILAELDRDREFIIFARELDDQLTSPGEYAAYEDFMDKEGKIFLSVRAGKVAVKRNAEAPSVSYPLISVPQEARQYTDADLILGLSRQESEFNPRALSSANARGLMQLLPSTAQITARKEGIPYNRSRLLDDPTYNMILGSAHLSHLRERFDGSYIMTLAGYNAGPHRVDQWIETYGDPRDPNVDPVDWVELIPFSETRNYVQRVMENTQIYRARIKDKPIPGELSRDLVRGGGTITAIGIEPPTPVISRARASASLSSTIPARQPVAFIATASMSLDDMLIQPTASMPVSTVSGADRLMMEQLAKPASAAPAPPASTEAVSQMPAAPISNVSSPEIDALYTDQSADISAELVDTCGLGEESVFLSAEDLNAQQLASDDSDC